MIKAAQVPALSEELAVKESEVEQLKQQLNQLKISNNNSNDPSSSTSLEIRPQTSNDLLIQVKIKFFKF